LATWLLAMRVEKLSFSCVTLMVKCCQWSWAFSTINNLWRLWCKEYV